MKITVLVGFENWEEHCIYALFRSGMIYDTLYTLGYEAVSDEICPLLGVVIRDEDRLQKLCELVPAKSEKFKADHEEGKKLIEEEIRKIAKKHGVRIQ